jgi:hypothetical protein
VTNVVGLTGNTNTVTGGANGSAGPPGAGGPGGAGGFANGGSGKQAPNGPTGNPGLAGVRGSFARNGSTAAMPNYLVIDQALASLARSTGSEDGADGTAILVGPWEPRAVGARKVGYRIRSGLA